MENLDIIDSSVSELHPTLSLFDLIDIHPVRDSLPSISPPKKDLPRSTFLHNRCQEAKGEDTLPYRDQGTKLRNKRLHTHFAIYEVLFGFLEGEWDGARCTSRSCDSSRKNRRDDF